MWSLGWETNGSMNVGRQALRHRIQSDGAAVYTAAFIKLPEATNPLSSLEILA
jgi:hypothetical protein